MFYLSEPVDNSWNTWYREIGNPVYYMKKWSGTMENSVKNGQILLCMCMFLYICWVEMVMRLCWTSA